MCLLNIYDYVKTFFPLGGKSTKYLDILNSNEPSVSRGYILNAIPS